MTVHWTELLPRQRVTARWLKQTFVTGHPRSRWAIGHLDEVCGAAVPISGERDLYSPCAFPAAQPGGRCVRHGGPRRARPRRAVNLASLPFFIRRRAREKGLA